MSIDTKSLDIYLEVQRYLQESIEGVTWEQIGETFKDTFGEQQAVDAAAKLCFLGFTFGVGDERRGMFPARLVGASDGIKRLREVVAWKEGRGTDSWVKGWSKEDSKGIYSVLTYKQEQDA